MRLLETIDLPAKKLASLTQAFLVISITGKITPLSFRQIFFKIFQSAGSRINLPITLIILNIEQKIIFTEQGQNEVTLKNAPGWGKRIQLDIRNLNQIGGRTEQTFLRGERSFLRGEQTFLRGEQTILRGERTFLRGEQTILRGERTFLRGEQTILRGEQTFLRGEQTILRGEQTFLRGEQTFLRGEQTLLRGEQTSLRDEQTFNGCEFTLKSNEQTIQMQTNNFKYKR